MSGGDAGYRLAEYEPSDFPSLAELLRLEYPDPDLAHPDYFRWQSREGPAGEAIVSVARSAAAPARVIGLYSVLPLRVKLGAEIALGSVLLNAVVHPEYRGRGVLVALAEHAFARCAGRGIRFSFGFPNPNSRHAHVARLAAPDMGTVPLLVRPLDLRALLAGRGVAEPLARLGDLGHRLVFAPWLPREERSPAATPGAAPGDGIRLREVASPGAPFDRFWESVKERREQLVVRDAAFLRWRFATVPVRAYRLLAAETEGGEVLGYAAVRSTEIAGVPCGLIVDFLVRPTREGRAAGHRLLAEITRRFRRERRHLAGCLMLPGTEESRLLARHGYLRCPRRFQSQPFPVILRTHPPGDRGGPRRDLARWFFTMGDFDAV